MAAKSGDGSGVGAGSGDGSGGGGGAIWSGGDPETSGGDGGGAFCAGGGSEPQPSANAIASAKVSADRIRFIGCLELLRR